MSNISHLMSILPIVDASEAWRNEIGSLLRLVPIPNTTCLSSPMTYVTVVSIKKSSSIFRIVPVTHRQPLLSSAVVTTTRSIESSSLEVYHLSSELDLDLRLQHRIICLQLLQGV